MTSTVNVKGPTWPMNGSLEKLQPVSCWGTTTRIRFETLIPNPFL
jgi:hypothetical protein